MPLPVTLPLASVSMSCPRGQETRPRKRYTRQTRVSHWNERDSRLTSVAAKPGKLCWYSSSGIQGSPTPPLWQPWMWNAMPVTAARRTIDFLRIIVGRSVEVTKDGRGCCVRPMDVERTDAAAEGSRVQKRPSTPNLEIRTGEVAGEPQRGPREASGGGEVLFAPQIRP